MSDRVEELKGDVKKGLGDLTGNERLEAEGEVQAGEARAGRKTKGALQEAGGAVKEGLGKLTGDEARQAAGAAERLRGKATRAG
jgi:uncharacterized protein YjbJ (UPF0337 family)